MLRRGWPKARNICTQHITTLSDTTLLQHVGWCARRFKIENRTSAFAEGNNIASTWPNENNIVYMQHLKLLAEKFAHFKTTTRRKILRQGGQMYATCCAQPCCDMLHWNVAFVWPGLKTEVWN